MANTILGIDFGHKRIGLALCESDSKIPSPLPFLPRSPQNHLQLVDIIAEHNIAAIAIGMPYNMDGSKGRAAERVEQFGGELAKHTEVPIFWVDERLTSFEADDQMRTSGVKPKKRKHKRDSIAACILLQTFLESDDGKGW